MRKEYIYIFVLIACIIGVMYGIVGLINTKYNPEEAKIVNNVQNIYENEKIVTTVSQEEKISPNADFALKKYYSQCKHFEYEEVELPNEFVNLTRQEIEDYYDDWEIEEFSENNLVLCKEIEGYCNQHFIIRLDGDNVNVYRVGSLGELNEYKKTDISKDYLTAEDIHKLEKGIPVYSEGKLSSVLEDFE